MEIKENTLSLTDTDSENSSHSGLPLNSRQSSMARVTSVSSTKLWSILIFFIKPSVVQWHCLWTTLASGFNTGNFLPNPVNRVAECSLINMLKDWALGSDQHFPRTTAAGQWLLHIFWIFLWCYVCDVERYNESRTQTQSTEGWKTKNIQCPRLHLGTVSSLTSVCDELNTHKNNGGDFQITGMSVPLDHRPQLLC